MNRHELSVMFGDMPTDQFNQLADDIKRNGLRHPVTVWQGQIVDGWHRFKACKKAGIEPRFTEFAGDDRAALALVMSENARRRHLSEAMQITIRKKVLGWHEAQARRGGDRDSNISQGYIRKEVTAADVAGETMSVATVNRHTALERKSPALLALAERGEIGLKTAERIASVATIEVLQHPTKPQIEALSAALSERPQARCNALLRAANDLRDQWQALCLLPVTDDTLAALHEARFLVGQCRLPSNLEVV